MMDRDALRYFIALAESDDAPRILASRAAAIARSHLQALDEIDTLNLAISAVPFDTDVHDV